MAEDAFYDVGFMNQTDDLHFMAASRATERVHFPDLLDELSPGFRRHAPWLMVGHIQHRHLRSHRRRRRLITGPKESCFDPFSLNTILERRFSELETKLNQPPKDSSNSSVPPSKDRKKSKPATRRPKGIRRTTADRLGAAGFMGKWRLKRRLTKMPLRWKGTTSLDKTTSCLYC